MIFSARREYRQIRVEVRQIWDRQKKNSQREPGVPEAKRKVLPGGGKEQCVTSAERSESI